MKGWGSVPLRLGLGIMFVAHGLQHTFGLFGGSGIEGFAKGLSAMGFGPAVFWAILAGYAELLCGLCLILGLFARIATIPLLIVMFVALFKVHFSKGFFAMGGGFEYNFVIIAALISLLITGSGKLSITKKW